MRFSQDQKVRLLGNIIKGGAVIGFASLIGYLLYNVASA